MDTQESSLEKQLNIKKLMKITPSRDVKVHLIGKRQTSFVFFFL
jgi:hypothetical protein